MYQEQSNKLKLHQNLIFRIIPYIADFANWVRNTPAQKDKCPPEFDICVINENTCEIPKINPAPAEV